MHGPVSQTHLLLSLGISARAQALAKVATPEQAKALEASFMRLVGDGPEAMGASYRAMAIVQEGLPAPVGFEVMAEAAAAGGGEGEGASSGGH